MKAHRILVVTLAAALATLVLASAALATPTTVRLEGAALTVMPQTTVNEGASGGTYSDSAGDEFTTTRATAFGAIALATEATSTVWDFSVSPSLGVFVNSFSGLGMDPVTFADWWQFSVNGYSPPVGVASLNSVENDSYLLFQNSDSSYPPRAASALVLSGSSSTLLPGQALTLKVAGDDLNKVNSQADATRFDVADPALIETPAQFTAVTGSTVYVDGKARAVTGSELTLSNLSNGTHAIWAEKAMDATTLYVRSPRLTVNVGEAPVITTAGSKPKKASTKKTLRAYVHLSKAGTVSYTMKTASGKKLASGKLTFARAGSKAVVWPGRTSLKLGSRITISYTGVDNWGREAKPVSMRIPTAR